MLDMRAPGVGVVSELRSVVASLRAESLAELPDARVEQDFTELHVAVEALEAERLRRLAEIDRRRLYERDGHLSVASWLTGRFCMTWGAASSDIRFARGLEVMPLVRRALQDGVISLWLPTCSQRCTRQSLKPSRRPSRCSPRQPHATRSPT